MARQAAESARAEASRIRTDADRQLAQSREDAAAARAELRAAFEAQAAAAEETRAELRARADRAEADRDLAAARADLAEADQQQAAARASLAESGLAGIRAATADALAAVERTPDFEGSDELREAAESLRSAAGIKTPSAGHGNRQREAGD
jgi:hypothetical protein